MNKRITIYCSFLFDKKNGCKISYLKRINGNENEIRSIDTKLLGSEILEEMSLSEAISSEDKSSMIEIFMPKNKLYKKILKNRHSKELKSLLVSRSAFIYWLDSPEKDKFINILKNEMIKKGLNK